MKIMKNLLVFVIIGLVIGASMVPIISSTTTNGRNIGDKEEDRNIIEKKTPFLNFELQDLYDLYKLIKSRFNPLSSWKKQATLNPLVGNDDENGLSFGWSIDIDGEYAIIGEYGAAYVFKRIGIWWYEQAVLTASDELAQYPGVT